jgi:uncharacterized OB-fold protein
MAVGPIARDDESAEFFEAAANNVLLVQHCGQCGHRQYPLPFAPSVGRCRACGSTAVTWQAASGSGRLVSWAHLHGRPGKDTSPAPVTTVAIVELDEGPWVFTQLHADPGTLHAGDPVTVSFDRADSGEVVPVFTPQPASA